MLRHTGQNRTNKHNIRLASLLCLTAGFVNGGGFLAFLVLTTNVTGHVALFAEKLAKGDFRSARIVGLWMLLFLLGAFVCSFVINKVGKNQRYAYTLPILIEIGILIFVGSCGPMLRHTLITTEILAGSLLFAMGLQNAMVSMISGSVVRTTHLTGMFTDLGIELAAIIKLRPGHELRTIHARIYLRIVIIVFFFLGCIFGAILYKYLKLQVFYIPTGILIIAMFFDIFRIKVIKAYRNVKHLIHHTS
jgi:uncharacterized membrane protein YoaK (UPF0700 family)